MRKNRPEVFRGRHFQDELIVLCVRWYLRYSLSYRDLEEMIAERGLGVDHSTIARWGCGTLRFSTNESGVISGIQIGPGGSMKHMSAFLANGPIYIELDSEGNSIDFMLSPYRDRIAAKHFLQLALSRVGYLRPRVINVDGHPPYPSVITELKQTGELSNACRCRPSLYMNNVIEQDHRFVKKRIVASQWFRSVQGAVNTVQGYEAMHIIRKGQIRWLTKGDVVGQVWFVNRAFGLAA